MKTKLFEKKKTYGCKKPKSLVMLEIHFFFNLYRVKDYDQKFDFKILIY